MTKQAKNPSTRGTVQVDVGRCVVVFTPVDETGAEIRRFGKHDDCRWSVKLNGNLIGHLMDDGGDWDAWDSRDRYVATEPFKSWREALEQLL